MFKMRLKNMEANSTNPLSVIQADQSDSVGARMTLAAWLAALCHGV